MPDHIELGPIHHLRLTVTDIARSRDFYTNLLGFSVAAEAPESEDPESDPSYPVLWGGIVMAKGNYLLGLRPVASKGDRFDEDRVGLDHLSFGIESRAALDAASKMLDDHGVPHGEVRELTSFGICVLPFRDPDNIQLELTSPL
ncbi:MAG TPA: VOC family protein [Candidatus Dormibacteraeota bacterium]|nr:VOC family protein [Candidatus Dormibacteraeota bacterium]